MSVAHPAALLLGLLELVVLALHLRRRRSRTVGSTHVWRRVANVPAVRPQRAPWRSSLPLILQLLAVALATLAVAGPHLGARPPVGWVVVLDGSGSMLATDVAPDRWSAALAYLEADLRRRLASGRAPRHVSIVIAGPATSVVATRLAGDSRALAALAGRRPVAAPPDWRDLGRYLPALAAGDGTVEVTILTDPSGAAPAEKAVADALPGAVARVRTFAGPTPRNVGLTAASASPDGAGAWRIRAGIRRFAGDATDVRLELLFTPSLTRTALPWSSAAVHLGADGSGAWDQVVQLPSDGVVELRLASDDLDVDDHAYLVLREDPVRARVLEVGPADADLERALLAVPGVELERSARLPADTTPYDLVVIDGVRVDARPATSTWWLDAAAPQLPLGAVLDQPVTIAGPDRTHPLARGIDWSEVHIARAHGSTHLPGATVLLEAGGHPLVQARTTPTGREVVTSFALADSDWPDRAALPAFAANLLRWTVPGLDERTPQPCSAGSPCGLGPALIGAGARVVAPDGSEVTVPDAWFGADARSRTWAPQVAAAFRPALPGIYRAEGGAAQLDIAVDAFGSSVSALSGSATPEPRPPRAPPLRAVSFLLALAALAAEAALAYGPVVVAAAPRRGRPRARANAPWGALGARVLALVLLAAALARAPLPVIASRATNVVVEDDPSLYSAAAGAALQRFEASLVSSPATRGSVALGPRAVEGTSASDGWGGTDLGAALALAAGAIAPGAGGRVTLAGAPLATGEELGAVVAALQARGLPVDVASAPSLRDGDVQVTRVDANPTLRAGVPFDLRARIVAPAEVDATVGTLRDGSPEGERAVRLAAGVNDVRLPLTEAEPGPHLYEVAVRSSADPVAVNDTNGVARDVLPPPRVALVAEQPAWAQAFAEMLTGSGAKVTVLEPGQAPWDADGWSAFDVAALMNVPAVDLDSHQQEALEAWVRDRGGGLLLLGGPNSFGPGGYFQTALERLSPLSSKIPREAPQVALLFVLDRSGSMQQLAGSRSRLAIAKAATLDAMKLLNPASLTGVIAFDTVPTVAVPLEPASAAIADPSGLDALTPGGGTSLYPALVEAGLQMSGVESMAKQVVVLSDGLSQAGDFEGVLADLRSAGVRTSIVAVGRGADVRGLQALAALGGGAFHATTDVQALPGILAQEALLLSGSAVKEEAIVPLWDDHTAGFGVGLAQTLPPLDGYVLTTPKTRANVALAGADGTPLLASWPYGVGRVLAFASEAAGPWARSWAASGEASTLWLQALRWALPATPTGRLHVTLERDADVVQVSVDSANVDDAPAVVPAASLTSPTGARRPLPLRAVGAGRFTATFGLERAGTYRVDVATGARVGTGRGAAPSADSAPEQASASVYAAYPARYADADLEPVALAELTGGASLDLAGPVPVARVERALEARRLAAPWAIAALAFVMLELAVRYGVVPVRARPARSSGRATDP